MVPAGEGALDIWRGPDQDRLAALLLPFLRGPEVA